MSTDVYLEEDVYQESRRIHLFAEDCLIYS